MASLHEAVFWGTRLQGETNLSYAQLQGASLIGARLQGANLYHAHLPGADLFKVQLQGATLNWARLQGISPFTSLSFAAHIRAKIGQENNLSEVILTGGLSREDVDSLVEDLPDEEAEVLRHKLKPHIGQPANHEPPEGCRAFTDPYTKKDAEQWIAEYQEAMGGASQAGEG